MTKAEKVGEVLVRREKHITREEDKPYAPGRWPRASRSLLPGVLCNGAPGPGKDGLSCSGEGDWRGQMECCILW